MQNRSALERLRPWPVYLMAAALPVSMAATSIAKLLIALVGAAVLLQAMAQRRPLVRLDRLLSLRLAGLILLALGLSIGYSSVPWTQALGDWGKYAKLIVIPLILLLLRSERESAIAVGILLVTQSFVLLSSCLLGLGVNLPWVPMDRNAVATVFTSYLDQSMMTAGYAALCWHLRQRFPGGHGALIATVLAGLALINVIVMLPGRSGQLAILAVATLAIWWALPPRKRLLILGVPLLLVLLAGAIPSEFQERMGKAVHEATAYEEAGDKTTSTGLRLNFWHRSVQAIAERPWTGYGVGSWGQQFLRLDGPKSSLGASPRSNPHQEFLQFGVQLGVGGIVLLAAFMLALAKDAAGFSPELQRATQSIVAVFAVSCMFNSALFDALIGDYFCGTLGMLLAWGWRIQHPSKPLGHAQLLGVPA